MTQQLRTYGRTSVSLVSILVCLIATKESARADDLNDSVSKLLWLQKAVETPTYTYDNGLKTLAVSPDGKLVAFTDGQHPGICPQHHTQPDRLRDKIRLEERPGKSHAAEAGVAQRVET